MSNYNDYSTYGQPQQPQRNNWGQPHYNTYQPPVQFNTNVAYVTSLEEALIKNNMYNSDMIYFDQDKNVFYRVKVDQEGRKTWAQFQYNMPNQGDNVPATKEDIRILTERIKALEDAREPKATVKKKKEVTENAELDG